MLDRVGWTLTDVLDLCQGLELKQEQRPPEFRQRVVGEGEQTVRLSGDGWLATNDILNIKYARIQGVQMDIATVMIYPTGSPDLLPVFAAEWVLFRDRIHAAILDVEIAGRWEGLRDDMRSVLGSVGSHWQEKFPPNLERPLWFQEIAEDWAIFSSCSADKVPTVREMFCNYLQIALDAFYFPRMKDARGGEDHPDVRRYKEHHCEHSPGRKVMSGKMGTEFTESFLGEWHFGPPALSSARPYVPQVSYSSTVVRPAR
ncbi:MAG: hypothetical protein ACFCD0_27180 [Gemmataceae bacterium]